MELALSTPWVVITTTFGATTGVRVGIATALQCSSTCLSAYLCGKVNQIFCKVSLHSLLALCRVFFSLKNSEKTLHGSPIKASYGVLLRVYSVCEILSKFSALKTGSSNGSGIICIKPLASG